MSDLLSRLRQETRPLHEETEQLFYTEALRDGTLLPVNYTHLLRTHLVFHQALETAIDRHADFFQGYEPEIRRKTPWLVADLAYLQETLPAPVPELFANWSPVALLGATYVGEGSILGGTVIGRLLQQNEAIQPLLTHARFYQGYGPATGSNWKNFGAFLTQKGTPVADDVVDSAGRAFTLYQRVFQQNQPEISQIN